MFAEDNVSYTSMNYIRRICSIRVSKIDGEYVPHKPLFLVYLLGLIHNQHVNLFTFREIEQPLSNLIRNFGNRKLAQPQYPFWHLINDGFWILTCSNRKLLETLKVLPSAAKMRGMDIKGHFEYGIYKCIQEKPDVTYAVLHNLLTQFLPYLDEMEVFSAIGLGRLHSEKSHQLLPKQKASSVMISVLKNTREICNSQKSYMELSASHSCRRIDGTGQKNSNEIVASKSKLGKSIETVDCVEQSETETNQVSLGDTECTENSDYAIDKLEELIVEALDSLPARERDIIISCEGLLPESRRITFAEMARRQGISRERIRQLYKRGVNSASSYASWNLTKNIFTSINPKEVTGHRCMNLYDFQSYINERANFEKYEPLACVRLALLFAGMKNVFKGGTLNYECISVSPQTSPKVIEDPFQLIKWFYGINQYEIEYLNERYDLFQDLQRINSFSIKSSVWSKLSKKEISIYLKASALFSIVLEKWCAVKDAVIDSGGTVSNNAANDIITRLYNVEDLNSNGILRLFSEMLGGLKYDAKHYLWIADGYSWRDNEKYQLDDYSNFPVDGKKMSQTNAAHRILLECNEPETFDEIMKIAIKRGYIKTIAKNPSGGLRSLVYIEQQMDKKLGRESRFAIVKGGYLALTGKGQELFEGDNRQRRTTKGRIPYSELAYTILDENGGAMHYTEIAEAIQNNYGALNSNSSPESIQNALKREEKQDNSRFIEIEDGVWALSYFAHVDKNGVEKPVKKELDIQSTHKNNKVSDNGKSKFLDFLGLGTDD